MTSDDAPPPSALIRLRRELVADGLTDKAIRSLVADGSLHRVRFGAYADGGVWRQCDEAGRHALRSRAVLRQARTHFVLSHLSAAVEWQAPLWSTDLGEVHVTRSDRLGGRREAGVRQHLGELRDGDVVLLNGVPVTSAARTALDAMTLMDAERGLVVVNDLLHRGLTTHEDLRSTRLFMERWPGTLRHTLVLRQATHLCESVGESRAQFLFWHEGLPAPVMQHPVRDLRGGLLARLDFAWPELRVWAEFDGKVKYEKLLRPGASASDVVVLEKRREDLVRERTGWICVRLTWADLDRPQQVAQRLRHAFRVQVRVG